MLINRLGGGGEKLTEEINANATKVDTLLAKITGKGVFTENGVFVWYKYDSEGGNYIETVVSNVPDAYPNGAGTDGFWYEKQSPATGDTYLISDGENLYPTTLVDDPPLNLTATKNDVRLGKTAILSGGLETGEKDIPLYHTHKGAALVMPNQEFKISFDSNMYDFTALQAVIAPYNTSMANSVAVDKTVIETEVYPVQSTEKLSDVVKNAENKTINLGITNGASPYVIKYFTYKEVL